MSRHRITPPAALTAALLATLAASALAACHSPTAPPACTREAAGVLPWGDTLYIETCGATRGRVDLAPDRAALLPD